jgi:hypothetical protein
MPRSISRINAVACASAPTQVGRETLLPGLFFRGSRCHSDDGFVLTGGSTGGRAITALDWLPVTAAAELVERKSPSCGIASMSGIRRPSSAGKVARSGAGIGSGSFSVFTAGASATTTALGAAHDIIAPAIAISAQTLCFMIPIVACHAVTRQPFPRQKSGLSRPAQE